MASKELTAKDIMELKVRASLKDKDDAIKSMECFDLDIDRSGTSSPLVSRNS